MSFITWCRALQKVQIHPVLMEATWKQSMCSNVKFYEEDNELHEIHFPVWLGVLKEVKVICENSNTSDFN